MTKDLFQDIYDLRDVAHCAAMVGGKATLDACITIEFALSEILSRKPIPMILYCPKCQMQHIDAPDESNPNWTNPPHRSHLCQNKECNTIWRPCDFPTEGVEKINTVGTHDNFTIDSICDVCSLPLTECNNKSTHVNVCHTYNNETMAP